MGRGVIGLLRDCGAGIIWNRGIWNTLLRVAKRVAGCETGCELRNGLRVAKRVAGCETGCGGLRIWNGIIWNQETGIWNETDDRGRMTAAVTWIYMRKIAGLQ